MEIVIATCLIVVGLTIGLLGLGLFRLMLPLAGFIVGGIVGFTGIQGIFGTGVTSTTIAVLVACVFGLVLALLSYAFFNVALVVLVGLAFSSLFTLLAVALGLSANGFVVFMLSVAGFIIGAQLALSAPLLGASLVSLVTALVGTGLVLAGLFVLGSSVSVAELHANGVIATVAERVSNSFWWLLVWIASAVIMRTVQLSSLLAELFPEELSYHEKYVNNKEK